jgi:hypothetical protein
VSARLGVDFVYVLLLCCEMIGKGFLHRNQYELMGQRPNLLYSIALLRFMHFSLLYTCRIITLHIRSSNT